MSTETQAKVEHKVYFFDAMLIIKYFIITLLFYFNV
jgi:hypothetical protein